MSKIYVHDFNLYSFDKRSGKMDPSKLISLMCETAVIHTYDASDYQVEDGFWVVYNWDLKKHIDIRDEKKISIKTEITGVRKFFCTRNFYVYNEDKKLCYEASSQWLLLDTKERSAKRIPKEYIEYYDLKNTKERTKTIDIPEGLDLEPMYTRKMAQLDIDDNNHVNNGVYIEIMINSLDSKRNLKELSIIYKKESFEGQVLTAKASPIIECDDEKCIYICIFDETEELKTLGKVIIGD